jgi:hypothetical protein
MSTVLDCIACLQCGYHKATYEFDCRDSSAETICMRCGYHESSEPKYDEDGNPCGWKRESSTGQKEKA